MNLAFSNPRDLNGTLKIAAILSMVFLPACWPSVKKTNLDTLQKVIEMSKGPCYGNCPVFTLTIYEKGIASYRGERFTDRLGTFVKQLDEKQFQDLLQSVHETNLWQFQDIYKSQIPDMATVTISIWENGRTKTVKGKDGRPASVMQLEEKIDEIANSTGWELKEKPQSNLPDYIIANELIVQLNRNRDIHIWARKYLDQELKVEKSLSPSGAYWLVSFNTSLIPPEEMLEVVRQDPDVYSVEFNKKLSPRN